MVIYKGIISMYHKMELSEIFLTFLVTSVIGMLLAVFRMLYKSKCISVECCCIKINRDVQAEEKEHEFDIEHGIIEQNSPTNKSFALRKLPSELSNGNLAKL